MEPALFCFHTPAALHFEWGGASRLGSLLGNWFSQRSLLLVTDRFLRESGLLAPALKSLGESGFKVTIFDAVVADPPESVLMDCLARGRDAEADIVVGLGGGSSMDVAKLAAVMLVSEQRLGELYGIGKIAGGRVPLVQIPTTAGTGSEVTNISILTTGESEKMGIVAPQLYADRVLLDAELTVGLPRPQTAATGIDAMVHAIEAYTGRHKKNPVSDLLAREALRLMSANLIRACTHGDDRVAREAMLLGSTLAGQAFANSPVGAVHALAYPLGGRYHLPHGLTNALMLGPVLRFNMTAAAPLYAELADVISAPKDEGIHARAAQFVSTMQGLMEQSGAPLRLRDVDVPEQDIPMLARDAMKQTRLLINNPAEINEADAARLYREAY
ncbi:iron-containing alcohol dehydrogenase [Martelella mediterranea]|uniref:iron-containing alcohol dehydrogenase n=1 Tax=Martelella mediterranea TaxID=293089 RepID=UPI001E602124|nr:iron-containing alcohol dehydrogenase [Martelella mediterranea]MCD1635200.1 iron-containing alcohol dehydrogenase [Martelella mediterranea]